MRNKILVGTNNQDKVREIKAILEGIEISLITPAELGIELDIEETGRNFYENALIKAKAFAKKAKMPVIGISAFKLKHFFASGPSPCKMSFALTIFIEKIDLTRLYPFQKNFSKTYTKSCEFMSTSKYFCNQSTGNYT